MNDFTQKINKVNDGARFWLHRCNHFGKHAWKMLGYDYSNNNFSNINGCYISIGCESGKWDYHTVETIRDYSNNKWADFEKQYKEKPRNRYYLYHFFFDFNKDDYIVIPSGGEFHVYQIVDDKLYTYNDKDIQNRFEQIELNVDEVRNESADFKFFRKVMPVRVQISRKNFAVGELCSKLKYQGTTLEITDNAAEILKTALISDEPFSIYKSSINSLKQTLYQNILNSITPDNFEKIISWYFKKKGADVYDVLPKNYSRKVEKEDADVLAVFEDLKIKIYVQAKAYTGETDLSKAVDQLQKYIDYHVDAERYTVVKWIICLAKDINDIKDYEKHNKDIRIINGLEFAEMLLNVGLKDIDEAIS